MSLRRGQDFLLGISNASSASHALTSLQPRVPRMLDRLCLHGGPGLLTRFAVSGTNLLLGSGFPVQALNPTTMVDQDNLAGVACGPSNPLEISVTFTNAAVLRGTIGCSLIPPEVEAQALDALREGRLWGPDIWGWGLGATTVAHQASATLGGIAGGTKCPKRATLLRPVLVAIPSTGNYAMGDLDVTLFKIAGTDMLASGSLVDVSSMFANSSDEDGLRIDDFVNADDAVEIIVTNNHATTDYTVQFGFFARP